MKVFGLIGKNIDYSFSRGYFSDKFSSEKLDCIYKNFDLENIEDFHSIFDANTAISGFNVTIPYKETIIPFLDDLDADARRIGAVNTIKINHGKRIGYNTDHYGFSNSLIPHLESSHKNALILGTGGASKAVAYALNNLGIGVRFVTRTPSSENHLGYPDLSADVIKEHQIIVNCTPLGTHPNINQYPPIPYQYLGASHLLYDLIYNPNETQFLKFGKEAQAKTLNGLLMLKLQAEKSWEIWNS